MIRIIILIIVVILFLTLSLPLLLIEWILGKIDPKAKDKSSLAIVKWAFKIVLFITGTKVTVKGRENIPTDRSVLY